MMTPCEERGYKVGDLFTVLADRNGFRAGTIVKLEEDDGSLSPRFSGKNSIYKATIAGKLQGAAFLLLDDVEVKEDKKREPVFRSPIGSAVVTYNSGATFHITKLIGVEVFDENVKVSRSFKRKGLTHEESVYIPVNEFASLVYKGAQGTMTVVLNERGTAFTHTQITHFTKLEM